MVQFSRGGGGGKSTAGGERGMIAGRGVGERRTDERADGQGPGQPCTRMDTHCHSKASCGAAARILEPLGVPECYSEPEAVFEQARARGMDLVTLTDHDTIDGALELVERGFPGVVIGEEVTVHFPEDGCKLHVLVWCLSPAQHEEIGRLGLGADVYQFAAWLKERNLPHALAHPLYVQNKKLTRRHIDRCALLFKGFETLNGAHAGTHKRALETYLSSLSPGRVHRMIDEQRLEPVWNRAWEKATTGGSDDHGLLNIGRTWTGVTLEDALACGVPASCVDASGKITCVREFFRVVMQPRATPGGDAGHSALLSHQLTTVAAQYLSRTALPKAGPTGRLVASKLLRFAGVRAPQPSKAAVALDQVKRAIRRARGERQSPVAPVLGALREGYQQVRRDYPDLLERLDPSRWSEGTAISQHERMAAFSDDLYDAMHAVMRSGAVEALRARDTRGVMDHVLSYLVLEATQAPALFSLFHQNKERQMVEAIEHDCAAPGDGRSPLDRPMRVLLFTDTLGDVNGVSRFIRNAADRALETGRDLRVITSTNFEVPAQSNIINCKPVFATRMPKYENLELALPPLVRMLRICDQMQPDVVHISTPGSVGLAGFLAAKMLRVPMVGVYHTDFPAYIDRLFKDESLTQGCSAYMRMFYRGFGAIFTRSDDYKRSLTTLGLPEQRIERLMPGIVVQDFHPRFRNRPRPQSGSDTVRVLYVGRVSVEKNMPMLSRVWKKASAALRRMGQNAELVIVGDGPYRATMERELLGTPTRFLGFRYGAELAREYADSDLFAFTSTTDTLGQVVMESQASGMPVLVTDQGGPREVVRDGETGMVLSAEDDAQWVDALVDLCTKHERRGRMGEAAHAWMQEFSMARSFDHFWQTHERVWVQDLAQRGITPRSEAQSKRGEVTDPVPVPTRGGASRVIAGDEALR